MDGFPTTTLHLSTLGGHHVIDPADRERGNVFQASVYGRWGMRGVFYVATGERLLCGKDGRARWRRDDWQGLKPYQWKGRNLG